MPFFWFVLLAFTISAVVIALTAQPNLLYDESYHFRVITFYAGRWSPFVAHEPRSLAVLGDLTRYGSYLFHYLMSFPERVLIGIGASRTAQFEVLRLITIGLAVGSVCWFRRVLTDAGVGPAVANMVMLVYCALPITTLVAATINYDNAMFLLAGIHLSLGVRAWRDERRSIAFYATFVAVGALACLVKYEYLPMYAGVTVAVGARIVAIMLRRRSRSIGIPAAGGDTRGRVKLVGALLLLALAVALFVERYVVNVARYRAPNPECDVLHSVSFCEHYGPWARNHRLLLANPDAIPVTPRTLIGYFRLWLKSMLSTATLAGDNGVAAPGSATTLSLITIGALIAALIVIITFALIVQQPGFRFLLIVGVVYAAALFWLNYGQYRSLHQVLAVQGRYAMMLIPLFLAAAGYGLSAIIRRLWGAAAPAALVGVVVVLVIATTQGGFFLNYFSSAMPQWYDPAGALHPLFHHLAGVARRLMVTLSPA